MQLWACQLGTISGEYRSRDCSMTASGAQAELQVSVRETPLETGFWSFFLTTFSGDFACSASEGTLIAQANIYRDSIKSKFPSVGHSTAMYQEGLKVSIT